MTEATKHAIDAAATTSGIAAATANWLNWLPDLLSAIFLSLSIIWILWRMWDRYKHGPMRKD